ncbi:MAG TPA: M28 family peptidase, partial [Terriglobales bacterium]|nr:M28 family peptidase [Terriglobales bacterium]
AHYDRWWHSANDNEAGVATMLEIARALSGSYQPKRSLMFLATGAEEGGMVDSDRDWLAGSWAFIQAHPEIMRRLVFDRNFDLSGWTATKGRMLSSPEIVQAQKQVIADLGLLDRITVIPGQDIGTDAWNFGAVGGGSTSLLVWNSRMLERDWNWDPKVEPNPFWKYSHTQFDLYRPDDYQNLLTELKVSTLSVLRIAEATNVPIRLTDVASWAEKSLDSDSTNVTSVSFDDARSALREFRSEAERVESLQKNATSPTQARVINDLLLNTRKNLMPWLYSDVDGSFRTTRSANTLAAIEQACTAAEKADREGALKALEGVEQLKEFSQYSPEVEQEERVYSAASNDWGLVYKQLAQLPAPELVALFRDLDKGGDVSAKVESLRRLEAQAKADLSRSLSLAAGQLRAATQALRTARLD